MAVDQQRGAAKVTWSILGSLLAHVVVVGSVGWVAYRSMQVRELNEAAQRAASSAGDLAIDLPGAADGTLIAEREVVPEGEVPAAYGGAAVARIDTGSAGAGGDVTGQPATNLAAMDDHLKLDPDLLNRLDHDQVQRLKTARLRTTREDRRATTRPMELTFLATGKGEHNERRPSAELDPSRGSMVAATAAVVGGDVGGEAVNDEGPKAMVGAARAGQLLGSPGVGVRDGRAGEDHRRAARIAYARPSVEEGKPTVPGIWNGRPNDTVDSDQKVANAIRSLVHASVTGGAQGEGRGGSTGSTDPGAGGGTEGRRSVARPMGSGDGDLVDWSTTDPALIPYFRKLHAKIDPLWANAFPKSAMLELKQGTVIIEFTIAGDGTAKVSWPPARPSGIDEFDRNCAEAIRRAGPFDPLPAALRESGRSVLRIRAPFVAKNPIVK